MYRKALFVSLPFRSRKDVFGQAGTTTTTTPTTITIQIGRHRKVAAAGGRNRAICLFALWTSRQGRRGDWGKIAWMFDREKKIWSAAFSSRFYKGWEEGQRARGLSMRSKSSSKSEIVSTYTNSSVSALWPVARPRGCQPTSARTYIKT